MSANLKATKIVIYYDDRTMTLNSNQAEGVMQHIRTLPGVRKLNWKIKLEKTEKKEKTKTLKQKKSPWKNSPVPMNCAEFVAKMMESKQRHVQIIGKLADEMRPGLETKGQWQVFFDRYKKEASILVPFSDEQLACGARQAIAKYPEDWTLETIKKEILKRKNGEK